MLHQYNMSYASVSRLSVLVTVQGPDTYVPAGNTTACTIQFVWVGGQAAKGEMCRYSQNDGGCRKFAASCLQRS